MESLDEVLQEIKTLPKKQRIFVREYLKTRNQTRSYMKAFGTTNEVLARSYGSRLAAKGNVKKIISKIDSIIIDDAIKDIVNDQIDQRKELIAQVEWVLATMEDAAEQLEVAESDAEIAKYQHLFKAPAFNQAIELKARLLKLFDKEQPDANADIDKSIRQILTAARPTAAAPQNDR